MRELTGSARTMKSNPHQNQPQAFAWRSTDVSHLIFAMIIWCVLFGTWALRRSVQEAIARKRRLEGL